ncbi:HD domain-containing protein [Paractinoplanes rishiriensis]|uniref:Metal-dependent phosphohydrolase, HD subdomain protein n=1 Tax=Paractinoplanes rishiriensis TaxID=1050105 RepID=A0A919JZC7_9ACTN|nr:HD domain-containing protein [Actinoplanes rishiriensis]GIE97710.1 metal-dependent phosphohydrolase, HD subdomain protein [Actinoplanes rishiriensis]
MDGVGAARDLARFLLADLPERWRHTVGVARRAESLIGTLPAGDGAVLVAAAWLHDVGYAAPLRDTGFHPLDGARHVRAAGWSYRITGLVAHHSGAMCVARCRGLADQLAEFPQESSPTADALVYADQTVGPDGVVMTFEDRLADMLHRHGTGSPHAAAHHERAPLLRAAVLRVEDRLALARLVPAA